MKRRRRLFIPFRWLVMEANAYCGPVIPPKSVVAAKDKAAHLYSSDKFRIGYYGKVDGLNCVWLVNARAEYLQTTDQRSIREDFEILERSDEADLYGDSRPALQPLERVS